MITLDACMVIAHLEPRDLRHLEATSYLREHADERFLMHSLNLAEVLVGGARAGRGQEMLDDLHAIGIRVADRAEGESLRLAHLRAESGLRLPDCCALDTALTSNSSTLATFDDNLSKVARKRGLVVAPTDQAH